MRRHMHRTLCLAFAAALLLAAETRAETNPLATLLRDHPRLLVNSGEFEQIKQRIATDPQLREWQSELRKKAKKALTEAPSRYELPDGKRLLTTSRRVLERVRLMAWMCQIEGGHEYTDRAWRELEAAAKFKDWNPSHFLDTAEMTHAFAIGYDWLYDAWTPEQRATLRAAIIEKGFKPALDVYKRDKGWHTAHHNWNQVCNGGMTTGALAIGDEVPDLAGKVLRNAIASIPRAMADYNPDGAWPEGPGYWHYGTAYNVLMLAALQSALGTDFGLSAAPGFSDTGLFPIYMAGATEKSFSFADCHEGTIRSPELFWFAKKFKRPEYAAYQQDKAAPGTLDILWHNAPPSVAPTLPLDKYFRHVEVVSMRSAWDDPAGLFVGFKAGDNKANHSHLDIGSFVLDALGVRWGVDLGSDNYNLPGYFGKQRWGYYRLRAEGHNTLVLNPGKGADQNPHAAAPITKFKTGPVSAWAVADLTPAYDKHAKSVQRGIALVNNRRNVLLEDEIIAKDKPVELWWFFHTRADIQLSAAATTATLTARPDPKSKPVQLNVRLLSPAGAKFNVMSAASLHSSPNPPDQAENNGTQKLAIHLTDINSTRIAVLFTPLETDNAPAPPPGITALSQW